MKKTRQFQEVLLMIGTRFASRQYGSKDATDAARTLPANESLKDACWNGLVREMIPEIFESDAANPRLYLWQIREANQFFALEMSDYPGNINKHLSIDPYRFLEVQPLN